MATKNADVRDTQVDQLANFFNRLDIISSDGATVLATFSLSWGTASTGQIGLTGTPYTETAQTSGTAAEAKLYHTTDPYEITNISVGTADGDDITMNTTAIEDGKDVELQDFTLTEPETTQ